MVLGDYFCSYCGTTNEASHNSSCINAPQYMRQLYFSMVADRQEEFRKEKEARQKTAHFCSHCGKDIEMGKPYKVSEITGKKYHKNCFQYRRK